MKSLCVDVDRLAYPFVEYLQAKQRLANAIHLLQSVQSGLCTTDYQLSMKASGLMSEAQRLSNRVDILNRYVLQSALTYRDLEMRLSKTAVLLEDQSKYDQNELINRVIGGFQTCKTLISSSKSHDQADKLKRQVTRGFQSARERLRTVTSAKVGNAESVKGNRSVQLLDGYMDYTIQGVKNRSLSSLIEDGITYSAEGALHIVNATAMHSFGKNGYVSVSAGVGNAEASGSIKGVLFDSDGLNPSLSAQGEAIVSAVQAKTVSVFKNDIFKNTFKARMDVGVVEASGKAVISKDEITLEGEVGASAAKASAENSFELFGFTLTIGASSEVGIGAGGGFSRTSNSISFGGRLACIFGLGADVKIEW